jgi:hypothetical protein
MNRIIVFSIAIFCCVALTSSLTTVLWASEKGATTADEYRAKYSTITYKTITVPSGAVFKLRSLDQRSFERLLARLGMSLSEYNNLKNKKYKKMSLKEINRHLVFWDEMIVESVVEPSMSIEEKDGKLPVRLLRSKDIRALQAEINDLASGETALPMKPLNRAFAMSDENRLTVTKLLLKSADHEGKKVTIKGLTDGELSDISILNRQKKKIILQRFYITDGKQKLLVLRFFPGADRLHLTSFLGNAFGKKDGQVPVSIKNGHFTSQLIDEPVIITHSRNIEKIKDRWIQMALKSMASR